MADKEIPGLLLGKQVPVSESYAPELLFPIPRSESRRRIGIGEPLPFYGVDIWHAYELSWLDASGKPQVALGRFSIPASSPNLVESKSLKLYLHSLNNTRFDSDQQCRDRILEDVSAVVGAAIDIELCQLDDPGFAGVDLSGTSIDAEAVDAIPQEPDAGLLRSSGGETTEQLYSQLLRSLCPVTGQPDWGSLHLSYFGPAIDRAGLLAYLLGFRQHQEFHEQCVERIFNDILTRCGPGSLTVQALYTRRGGLDICPLRSTEMELRPLGRVNRQ